MSRELAPGGQPRSPLRIAWASLAVPLILAGCATSAPAAPRLPQVPASPAANIVLPSVVPPPATPIDPLAALSAKDRKVFKACMTKTIRPSSGGSCAKLVLTKLKAYGFYSSKVGSSINVAGANAILNYQRSRGLEATASTTKQTWIALATNAPAMPKVLPPKCTTTPGVILCVDQAQRRLFWIKNGKVVKTFKVRLGGWNFHPKTHEWRVFPTANGTWKVFSKQVSPASDNYGSGAMPYSTMFHSDMYVHYSPGFHSDGYAKSSHGCVNIGQISEAQWIFKNTPIGAPVYIYSPKVASANSTTQG